MASVDAPAAGGMAEAWDVSPPPPDTLNDSTCSANIFDVLADASMAPPDNRLDELEEAHGRIAELEAQVQALSENEKRALKEAATLRALMLAMKGQLATQPRQHASGGGPTSMLSPAMVGSGGGGGGGGPEQHTPTATAADYNSAGPKRQLQYNGYAGPCAGDATVPLCQLPSDDECTVVHILRDSPSERPGFALGYHVPGRGYTVRRVVEGGPAEIAGLTIGDTIVSIDDCDLRNVGLDLATDCIRRASSLMTVRLGPETDDAANASFQPQKDHLFTSTPRKPAARGTTRSFYERSGAGIVPVMPVSAAEVPEHMRIKATVMGMEASAPDLWTFFLGWRRWRAKMSAKSQVTARYLASGKRPGDAGFMDAGAEAIAEGLAMAGLLSDEFDHDDLLAPHGVPPSDASSDASNGSAGSDDSAAMSDTESLLMEYASRPQPRYAPPTLPTARSRTSQSRAASRARPTLTSARGRKMPPEPSDKDYLQLESLIQSRRAQLEMAPGHAGQGQGSSSLLDQDEAQIAALGLQAEYELLGGTEPDSGDERNESYTQDIAASVYTSDLYINDTTDTAVAWEQFKSLFTPAVPPPADAGPAADAATNPTVDAASAAAAAVAEGLAKFAASEDQFQSIDLDYDSNLDSSRMTSPSPSDAGSQWSSANLDTSIPPENLESAAERAWRNNYLSTANELEAVAPPIVASPRRTTAKAAPAKARMGTPTNTSTPGRPGAKAAGVPTAPRAQRGLSVTESPPRRTAAAAAATSAPAVSPVRVRYDQNGRRVVVGGTRKAAVPAKGQVGNAAADASGPRHKAPTSSLSKKSGPKKRVNMATGAKGIFAQSLAAVRADSSTEAAADAPAAASTKPFDGNRTMRPIPNR